PADGGVPAPLLADGLLVVVHRIFHAQHDQAGAMAVAGRIERVGKIELKRRVTPFVVAEMASVAPAIGKEIGRANGEDHALSVPVSIVRNVNRAAIPANFVAWRRTMIRSRDF